MKNLFDFASNFANAVRDRVFSKSYRYVRGDRSAEIPLALESPGSAAFAFAGLSLFENSALFVASLESLTVDGAFVAPKEKDEIRFFDRNFGERVYVVGPDAGGSCWFYRPDDPAMKTVVIHARERRDYRKFQENAR